MKTEGGGAVRHLQMSESEIVSSYRTARNPKRQIGILAELNAVTPREIRQVLEEAGALVLKEENMTVMTKSASAPAEKAEKVVTVETLFDLLRGAVDAGYGEAPVTVERCRFTEMRLRVELLMTGGLRVGGEPVAVELEGVPEAAAGKED